MNNYLCFVTNGFPRLTLRFISINSEKIESTMTAEKNGKEKIYLLCFCRKGKKKN